MNFKNFEQHIPDNILNRGKAYFDNGAVKDLTNENGYWLANVYGTEVYEVSVKGIRSIKEWECDCPYDMGPICKHVTAVLFAVQFEKAKPKTAKSKKAINQVDEIFKNAKPEELLTFFKKNLRFHKPLKQKLLSEFLHLLDVDDDDRFNKVLDDLIHNAGGRYGFIDYREVQHLSRAFDKLLMQAELAIAQKNYVDALGICGAVLLKVPNLLLTVDDSGGYIQGNCHYALMILEKLLNAPIPPTFKDQIYDFMLDTFRKDKSDFDFKDELLAILLKRDLEKKRLIQIKNVVQKVFDNLEGSFIEYSQEHYLNVLIDIALRTGETAEANELISQHLQFPAIRKIKLNMLLEEENFELAKLLIIDGIKIAEANRHPGTVREWEDVFIEISRLENDVDEERRLLKVGFFEGFREMEYFTQLKATYDAEEWKEELEIIITEILGKDGKINSVNASILMQVFFEEKMLDRLLTVLQFEDNSPFQIDRYGKYLHKEYPMEMLVIYEKIIVNEAIQANCRRDYRKVAKRLKSLLKIEGGRLVVDRLLQKFRVEFKKRPAMMDELSEV